MRKNLKNERTLTIFRISLPKVKPTQYTQDDTYQEEAERSDGEHPEEGPLNERPPVNNRIEHNAPASNDDEGDDQEGDSEFAPFLDNRVPALREEDGEEGT